MCFLSAMIMLGADRCQCTDTDIKKAHLTTCCLEMPSCMPSSVNIGHIHPNTKTKICCMCVVGIHLQRI